MLSSAVAYAFSMVLLVVVIGLIPATTIEDSPMLVKVCSYFMSCRFRETEPKSVTLRESGHFIRKVHSP